MTGTESPEIFDMDDQVYGGDLVIGDDFGNGCWTKHYQAIADLNPAIKAINDGKLIYNNTGRPGHSDGTGKIPERLELFHAGALLW